VGRERWQRLQLKLAEMARVDELLRTTRSEGLSLAQLLRRTAVTWQAVAQRLPALADVPADVARQLTYDAKYEGYVARQQIDIDRQERLAARRIPADFDFSTVAHLRVEAREKLDRVRPVDISQASRISGITPADLAVLLVRLEGRRRAVPADGTGGTEAGSSLGRGTPAAR
jgi:tRNA uridine 5-carboxymethylaminomethyl modification enzyme